MKSLGKILRAIYTSPLLLIKRLKKTSVDNFIGGLIFGAIFSLIVNIATVQIQEMVTKQKTLEAIEREIYSHLILAEIIKNEVNATEETADKIGAYGYTDRFSTSVWDSGDASGYIYDLDPTLQDNLYRYYTTFIYNQNRHMEHAETSVNQLEFDDMYCLYSTGDEEHCDDTWIILQAAVEHFEEVRLTIAETVSSDSSYLLVDFHPTQDRLDSWFLKLFMGDEVSDTMQTVIDTVPASP